MKCGGRRFYCSLVAVVALALGMVPLTAHAQMRIVDCGAHQTVTSALKLPSTRPLLVKIRGTCTEAVTISRDNVTLIADPAGATITQTDPNSNTILIDGVKNVVIDGLIVSGARNGIVGINGAVFTVQNATVQNNTRNGVVALFNATATIRSNQIKNNGAGGIFLEGSSAVIVLNDINHNGADGIQLNNSGGARIGFDSRNQVFFRTDCTPQCTNKITNNGANGINISNGATAEIYGNLIDSNNNRGVIVSTATGRSAGNNTISNNGDDGLLVGRGEFFQGVRTSLFVPGSPTSPPSREFIAGNGTAKRDEPSVGFGVLVFADGTANLQNFEISGNRRDGVIVYMGGSAILRSEDPSSISSIHDNGTLANDGTPGTGTGPAPFSSLGSGILVVGGHAEVRGITVSNNKVHGINAIDRATVRVRAHVLPAAGGGFVTMRSEIFGNAFNGISANNGAAVNISMGTVIHDNGTSAPGILAGNGISLSVNSSAQINDSTIRNNLASGITLFGNSTLSIGGSAAKFPPIGDYPSGLQSFVTNNGLDGINASTNSVANLFSAPSTAANGAQLTTTITANGRSGLSCGQQSRVQGDLTGISLNHTSGTGADLAGTVLTTTTVFDSNISANKTVVSTTGLSSAVGSPVPSFFSASCF